MKNVDARLKKLSYIYAKKGGPMLIKSPVKRNFKVSKSPETMAGRIKSKALTKTERVIDPTGIAGSWSDNRSAAEIVANIHDSRKSRR